MIPVSKQFGPAVLREFEIVVHRKGDQEVAAFVLKSDIILPYLRPSPLIENLCAGL